MDKSFRQLLLVNNYPVDLVGEWNNEECEAEWEEFCSSRVQV